MSKVLGGYEENDSSKSSGLKEVTVSSSGNKAMMNVVESSSEMTQMISFNGNFQQYIGLAQPGTGTTTALWQIKKLGYNVSNQITSVTWANGTAKFDKQWSLRATYSYS